MNEEDFKGLFPVREEPQPRYKWCLWLRFLEWCDVGRVVIVFKEHDDPLYTLAFVRRDKVVCFKNRIKETGEIVLRRDGMTDDSRYWKWKFLNKKWEFIKNL